MIWYFFIRLLYQLGCKGIPGDNTVRASFKLVIPYVLYERFALLNHLDKVEKSV